MKRVLTIFIKFYWRYNNIICSKIVAAKKLSLLYSIIQRISMIQQYFLIFSMITQDMMRRGRKRKKCTGITTCAQKLIYLLKGGQLVIYSVPN